jgi:molybdopterin adenylyltransferase
MSSETSATAVPIGVVTVSDRATRGVYEDLSGPAIETYLDEVLSTPFRVVKRLVEDEQGEIEKALIELCDVEGCSLVVTTGGTGPAKRDVTPEALFAVCDKMMPGFGEAMRAKSLTIVPTAILSRQEAGLRGSSLIINLPGKPSSIRDCLDAVMPAVPYCIDLAGGYRLDTRPERMVAFRPKGK